MDVYRIARKKYAKDLSGLGARLAGGRWNSKGVAILYTAQSLSLAAFELAVHIPVSLLPKDLVVIKISLPNGFSMHTIEEAKLSSKWNKHPPTKKTKGLGDKFVESNEALVLRVPSAVISSEYNYLVNPAHPLMTKVKISDNMAFQYDKRLFFR